jgi:predicted O-methyltransferase YrrM
MTQTEQWRDVPGWLTDKEAAALQYLAHGRRVLEIGCLHGKSAVAMGAVASVVVTCDHFNGDGFTEKATDAVPFTTSRTYESAMKNIRGAGMAGHVFVMAAPFPECLQVLDREAFDVFFYDGDHTYEATKEAIDKFGLRGKALAIHDYSPEPKFAGVVRAVDEAKEQHGVMLTTADCLAVLHYQGRGR